jgi:hypothetical protein
MMTGRGSARITDDQRETAHAAARRIDPNGRAALFAAPPTTARDQLGAGDQKDGRQAFFSIGPRRSGTVVVTCSSCHTRSRITVFDLALRLLTVSVWVPVLRHPHWMRCPACGKHTWCGVAWTQ